MTIFTNYNKYKLHKKINRRDLVKNLQEYLWKGTKGFFEMVDKFLILSVWLSVHSSFYSIDTVTSY